MTRLQPASLVILAGVCAALHVGKLPAALPVLRDAVGASLLQAGFLLSLVQLAGMTLGIAVGLLADGLGLRRTMVSGLCILALASGIGGFCHEPSQLLALRALEGFGFLLVTMPGPGLIRRLVASDRLSGALGWWSAFMPIGTAVALLGGPAVMEFAGWPGLWEGLAAVTLLVAVAISMRIPVDGKPAGTETAPQWSVRLLDTVSSRGAWLVALCFAVYSAQWMSVIGFLPTIYSQAGWAVGWTALATGAAAAANIIGNVAAGRLLHRGVEPDRLLLAGYAAMALGAWLAFGPAPDPLPSQAAAALRFGAVFLFSMVGGVIPGTLFSMAVRVAPHEGTVSTTVGWMQQWSCAGQFVGPPLVAWVAVHSGGWQGTWWVTCSFAVSGMALATGARKRFRAGAPTTAEPAVES